MATRKATGTRQAAIRSNASSSRVTRATTASRVPSAIEPPSPTKLVTVEKTKTTGTTRKPLVNRNIPDATATEPPKKPARVVKGRAAATVKSDVVVESDSREPIKAYLRIRPQLEDSGVSSVPYLKHLSSTSVQMTDPSGSSRSRLNQTSQIYTFNHVFRPETIQSDFFASTTLPLVRELLSGQNGLVFTYGVTNSGKTYTIQGGSQPDTAGLLPRTLDVVFNSIDDLQGDIPFRPVRLASVEKVAETDSQMGLPDIREEKALADVLGEISAQGRDSTVVKTDRNYHYAVWISYAEVYNEKVFDLLSDESSDKDDDNAPTGTPRTGIPRAASSRNLMRSTSTWQNLASLASSSSTDVLLVKRKALSLKNDPDTGGKYVSGLKIVRVRTTEEAKRVFRTGNINRRVFGTLANAASSRSHGVFTINVVRVHKADQSDVTVSRLSIVDLAGSERSKNAQTTGERLKEAGNINKSLMVLGQCMEALRSNQRRLAASLAAPGRGILDGHSHSNLKLAIVPFRHSKLTELFQDFFVGEREGRAVMIVNVNPYDTGFDENSHVMRFAALAKEVSTAPAATPVNAKIKESAKPVTKLPQRRSVVIATGGKGGRKVSQAHLEIVEEDEENDEDNDGPTDPLVDTLFEEIEELRIKLYESEMRCAIIEAETREEVMKEMEERMMAMERNFGKRLLRAVEQNEAKTDAKIDLLHQFGAFSSKRQSEAEEEEEEALEDEESGEYFDINNIDDEGESTEEETASQMSSIASSPLQNKGSKSKAKQAVVNHASKTKPRGSSPQCIGLRDEDMFIDVVDADETMTIGGDEDEDSEDDEDEVASSIVDDDSESSDGEASWEPSERSSPAPPDTAEEEEDEDELMFLSPPAPAGKSAPKRSSSSAKASGKGPGSRSTSRVTQSIDGLQDRIKHMSLFADEEDEDEEMDSVGEEEPVVAKKGGRGSKATGRGKTSTASAANTRRSARGKK